MSDDTTSTPNQPEPGQDSRVEDWFGQSAAEDQELADELSEGRSPEEAAEEFEKRSTGREEQAARRGEHIDAEQGESAYRDDS